MLGYLNLPGLMQNNTFKYLGLWIHSIKGIRGCIDPLQQAGIRAMWGMVGRYNDMEMRDLYLRLHMFDCLLKPVLSYGSEVWGVAEIGKVKGAGGHA